MSNIAHADFVAGVRNGKMGFKCVGCQPYQLVCGVRRNIFSALVLLYVAAPLILVPLWAWHEGNWWLLIGVVASFAGTFIASSNFHRPKNQATVAALLLMASVASWISAGLHNYFTFFALCGLFGSVTFMIADNAEREYATQSLMEDAELFNSAVSRNWITVVNREFK